MRCIQTNRNLARCLTRFLWRTLRIICTGAAWYLSETWFYFAFSMLLFFLSFLLSHLDLRKDNTEIPVEDRVSLKLTSSLLPSLSFPSFSSLPFLAVNAAFLEALLQFLLHLFSATCSFWILSFPASLSSICLYRTFSWNHSLISEEA